MKHLATIMLVWLLSLTGLMAQNNYQNGLEAFNNEDYVTAIQYLTKAVNSMGDSKHLPQYYIGLSYYYLKEYKEALDYFNQGLENAPRKEKNYKAHALELRGKVRCELADTLNAIEDFQAALRLDQENYSSVIGELFSIYLKRGQKKKAFNLINNALIDHPNNAVLHILLAWYYNDEEKYDKALESANRAILIDGRKAAYYKLRSQIYYKRENYSASVDDIIRCFQMSEDIVDDVEFEKMNELSLVQLKAHLTVLQNANLYDYRWAHYLGELEVVDENYEEALEYFTKANDIKPNTASAAYKIWCLNKLGRYREALNAVDKALIIDENAIQLHLYRVNLLDDMGLYKEELDEITKIISFFPNFTKMYSQRAWIYYHQGEFKKAINDYDVAIVLGSEDRPYDYLHRGRSYKRLGKDAQAQADFRHVLEIDSNPLTNDALAFAYYELGESQKALEAMEARLRVEKEEAYYDAACLYSLLNDKTKAIVYLRLALQNGYHKMAHIARDYDLDNIRDTEEFKALMAEYSHLLFQEALPVDTIQSKIVADDSPSDLQSSRTAFSNRSYRGDTGGTVVATTGMNVGGTSHDPMPGRGTVASTTRTINSPKVNNTTASNTRINSVTLTRSYTAISISSNNRSATGYYGWCNIDKNTYIVANGTRYTLTKADNIEIAPAKTNFSYAGQELTFTLYFPSIPISTTSIDLIEPGSSEWKYYGIQLQ